VAEEEELDVCEHFENLANVYPVGFDVARTGVASVGFIGNFTSVSILTNIGFPSVGKSTLMSKLTGTHSEVAAYECKHYPRLLD